MPLFHFVCESCEAKNELLVRGNAKPACPDCGSKRMIKQLSAFAPVGESTPDFGGCGAELCCRMDGGGCMN